MKPLTIVSILIITLLSASTLLTGQESGAPTSKALYRPSGVEGTITGNVVFVGEAPERRMIDMSADPVCVEMSLEPFVEDIVVKGGKLANVVVYVKSGSALNRYSFEPADSIAVMAHNRCRFEPHVLGVRVGQRLEISSNDATAHNTHPQPSKNPEWNLSQSPGAPPLVKTFTHAETFMAFKDNQHPWERAYLGVFDHPFFATTDTNGNYRIEGLPPGEYTLVAWQERLGEKTIEIRIGRGETQEIDFTFEPAFKQ